MVGAGVPVGPGRAGVGDGAGGVGAGLVGRGDGCGAGWLGRGRGVPDEGRTGPGAGSVAPCPFRVTTRPPGSMAIADRQFPSGSRSWSTETVILATCPGSNCPAVWLSWSQGASAAARQRTGVPPEARIVTTVVSSTGRASIVSRPGLFSSRPSGGVGPSSAPSTATETSGASSSSGRSGRGCRDRVLPAFS
ncbi:hypothetical protein [Streptomyces noursei]|uniref:hypothetical protein n=1 Tax=Streptomyces noursei TaxID=1971 RepID=UPI0030F1B29D